MFESKEELVKNIRGQLEDDLRHWAKYEFEDLPEEAAAEAAEKIEAGEDKAKLYGDYCFYFDDLAEAYITALDPIGMSEGTIGDIHAYANMAANDLRALMQEDEREPDFDYIDDDLVYTISEDGEEDA